MGYYFEFHIKVKLKKDLPEDVVKFFQDRIVNQVYETVPLDLTHDLFTRDRWECCFYVSAYHDKPFFYKLPSGYYLLILNGEIKSGCQEIEDCANWLSQWVVGRKKKQYLGWYKGESYEVPRINLYLKR